MRTTHRAVPVLVAVMLAACNPTVAPPASPEGVPIVDHSGQTVGTADPEAVDEAVDGGPPAEVCRDGEVVGHFGQDGFVPAE